MDKQLNIIITGATGMVGEGVLHECLNDKKVTKVLVIGRRACGVSHPKLAELLVEDFFKLDSLKGVAEGYHACLFCLGVSSVGMKEKQYRRLTYDLTIHFAKAVKALNPDILFAYVSGAATDSTEKGSSMWARVKGKTENDLIALFPRAYMFRPGYMQPTPGLKNTIKFYRYIKWMYPFLRFALRGSTSTLAELGQAMIHCAARGYYKKVLEVRDIVDAAHRNSRVRH